jgi:hypothetical protein
MITVWDRREWHEKGSRKEVKGKEISLIVP